MNEAQYITQIKAARKLVDRFFNGSTTAAEEAELYVFYAATPSLPDDLEQYRDMFAWYADVAPKPVRKTWWPRAYILAAAMVALLIAAGVYVLSISAGSSKDSVYACYQGSYVMHNGQRITEISQIYATLARAELVADSVERELDRTLMVNDFSDDDIINGVLADISDPQLALQIKADFLDVEISENE